MPKAAAYTLAWSSLHLAYELRAPDGDVALRMQHEEPAWFTWLAQGTSFAFEGRTPADCCLLRQETKQRGDGYWYAYQRSGKKLRKKYVGKAAAVTLARLEEVARFLNANHPGQSPILPDTFDPPGAGVVAQFIAPGVGEASWGHHTIRGKTHAKDAIRRANALLTTLR